MENEMSETMFRVRRAATDDLAAIMTVLAEAREYQVRVGNPQWREGYPGRDVITADIRQGGAVVLLRGETIVGYAVAVAADPGYDGISIWGEATPPAWCSIHRLALGDATRGQGRGRWFLGEIIRRVAAEGIREVRIDTGSANRPMQSLMQSLGFTCLGETEFSWGPRLAYRIKL